MTRDKYDDPRQRIWIQLIKTQEMIHIGHIPDDLLVTLQKDIAASEDHARLWTLSLLASALTLRELLPGQTSIQGSTWSFRWGL